jgi:hypothetical protein
VKRKHCHSAENEPLRRGWISNEHVTDTDRGAGSLNGYPKSRMYVKSACPVLRDAEEQLLCGEEHQPKQREASAYSRIVELGEFIDCSETEVL